jgi:hypothetical protein
MINRSNFVRRIFKWHIVVQNYHFRAEHVYTITVIFKGKSLAALGYLVATGTKE